jgi:hypothetical protein
MKVETVILRVRTLRCAVPLPSGYWDSFLIYFDPRHRAQRRRSLKLKLLPSARRGAILCFMSLLQTRIAQDPTRIQMTWTEVKTGNQERGIDLEKNMRQD